MLRIPRFQLHEKSWNLGILSETADHGAGTEGFLAPAGAAKLELAVSERAYARPRGNRRRALLAKRKGARPAKVRTERRD